ncbi:hypothetical protein GCM10022416_38910 [Actinomadura keratinilytica]|uniref:Uncharacterized protein n=1 Tax=Actinomadura keratinilytica TaxID=547461 RepID=A0ABP7Z357_9ACTN
MQAVGDGDARHRGDRTAQVVPARQPDPDAVERPVNGDLAPHCGPLSRDHDDYGRRRK